MRLSIQVFAQAMEAKLQRDDGHKEAWENTSLRNNSLIMGLKGEVVELSEALFMLHHPSMGDNNEQKREAVRLECCDVANYAMMIFSLLRDDTKNLDRGKPPTPGPFTHAGTMPSDREIFRKGL